MSADEAVTAAAERLQQANGTTLDDAALARLAPQLAELAAGLAALDRQLAPEAEPAIVERVDDRDW
jgi:hypothetical protein